MIRTEVVWIRNVLTAEQMSALIEEGKKYPKTFTESFDLESNTKRVVREWNNLQDAQNWIDFVSGFNPVSAVIISD